MLCVQNIYARLSHGNNRILHRQNKYAAVGLTHDGDNQGRDYSVRMTFNKCETFMMYIIYIYMVLYRQRVFFYDQNNWIIVGFDRFNNTVFTIVTFRVFVPS